MLTSPSEVDAGGCPGVVVVPPSLLPGGSGVVGVPEVPDEPEGLELSTVVEQAAADRRRATAAIVITGRDMEALLGRMEKATATCGVQGLIAMGVPAEHPVIARQNERDRVIDDRGRPAGRQRRVTSDA
jgi:hypothetical protein